MAGDWSALHFACCYNHVEVAKELLNSKEIKITKDEEGQTPITIAQNSNNNKLIELFSNFNKKQEKIENNQPVSTQPNENIFPINNYSSFHSDRLIDLFQKQFDYFHRIVESQRELIESQHRKIEELQAKLFMTTIENQKKIIEQQNEKIQQLINKDK